MKKLNLLLAEDETLVREGMVSLLRSQDFTGKLYETTNGADTLECIRQCHIDLLLLDVKLPDMHGLQIVRRLHEISDSTRILVITGLEGHELILNLLKSGVNGVVFKLDGFTELTKAIVEITSGGVYYSEQVQHVIRHYSDKLYLAPALYLNERDVLLLKSIISGDTTKQVADKLNMSVRTTETYRQRLLKKIGVPNTAALVAYAFRNGLI
jgi:two-component system, NarL family, response regulator NreC